MLIATLTAMQTANTGYAMRQVLAIDVPLSVSTGISDPTRSTFFPEAVRRIGELPGVQGVAAGLVVPWRDRSLFNRLQVWAEGYQPADGEENPSAQMRVITPGFFAVLGVPILSGRDFNEEDGDAAIVSQSVAQRMFPNADAVNRTLRLGAATAPPRRIIGIVADVDDQNVVQAPTLTIYQSMRGGGAVGQLANRLFVRAAGDPHALIPSVTRVIRKVSSDQAVERPATLEDVRAEVLTPERLNTFVFSALGGIALLIAVVGVAGVLAFSVGSRTREFGVRLAIGSTPRDLRAGVLWDGVRIASFGIASGAAGGYALVRVAQGIWGPVHLPGALPVIGAAIVLLGTAAVAALMPATRASRLDVVQALRSE
jgi:ABC-type antimicrobial peptide transport system permease subunit